MYKKEKPSIRSYKQGKEYGGWAMEKFLLLQDCDDTEHVVQIDDRLFSMVAIKQWNSRCENHQEQEFSKS